jgi:Transcriptional regulators containing a DNA-binding HTH domain and an aminotransferase domain (MocR family) and their eukaryotic orthologs
MIEFSTSIKNLRSSEIRRLMQLAADPSIISFAGGMPNNEIFPVDIVEELWRNLPRTIKQAAFQYGPTSGYPPLLASLKEYLGSKGLPIDESQGLLITTGAQQAINLVTKVLIDPGDRIITEYPSFIGALAAFKSYGAILKGIALDSDGIDIDELKKAIADKWLKPKMLYISPYFHNPAGIIYSKERKEALSDLLIGSNVCLLEDDPYGELYFNDKDRELTLPIKAAAHEKFPICYIGSFAKIFGPGMRLGWLLAPKEIVDKCEMAKQSMDACSATFTQVLANEFLSKGKLPAYVSLLRKSCARRADIMLKALEDNMPDGISWTRPKGGFYIWVSMPETMNASDVFAASLKKGAAFVIGNAFDPEEKKNNCFRLAFSHTPEEKIEKGIKIIGEAIKDLRR